jgi:menaquinone-9 beta-reductase
MRRVDVAIIGGSLAGATCVRELAKRGVEAVAFERDEFPREKVCGGFVSPGAVGILQEIGMLEAVKSAGATEVHAARVRTSGAQCTFELPGIGLGISRKAVDDVFGRHPGIERGHVRTVNGRTLVVDDSEVVAKVIVDAAGKLSRFTTHKSMAEFGVHFYEPMTPGGFIDFWFFEDGYGGSVAVEEGRSNCCFLINKDALPRYITKPGCTVTGPVAYDSEPSQWIAIGDAAGMIDPFCGEGIRHALDTGRMAARVIAEGLASGRTDAEMRSQYVQEREARWGRKRTLARWARRVVRRPEVLRRALGVRPEWMLEQLWR